MWSGSAFAAPAFSRACSSNKNELAPDLRGRADVIVADSISQCRERGEVRHALAAGSIDPANVVELGAVIDGKAKGRRDETAITIADLTGVAVQDIEICKAVLSGLRD
jgi:ornithine cyclodeaminase